MLDRRVARRIADVYKSPSHVKIQWDTRRTAKVESRSDVICVSDPYNGYGHIPTPLLLGPPRPHRDDPATATDKRSHCGNPLAPNKYSCSTIIL
ncbi:hypothetical protein J6590_026655 [Homalodisca vitripennis]|nr:hypothetical protein J6590_026655 [Homalodisca vitripennis]